MPASKPATPRTPLSPHKSGLLYGTASFETPIDASHFDKSIPTKAPTTKMESITNAAEKAASKGAGAVGMNVVRMKRWFGRKLTMAGTKANGAAVTSRVQAKLGRYDTVE